jgi:orotate phosphoribosyltransferase
MTDAELESLLRRWLGLKAKLKELEPYLDLVEQHRATLWQTAGALAEIIRGLPGPDGQPTRPPLTFDRIAAIPYAALPIGVALSLTIDRPMIYPRKEVKAYGTSRPIEGKFAPGEKVLIVDDLITRGDSKLEAIAPLKEAGLTVEDILVVLTGNKERRYWRKRLSFVQLSLCEMLDILARREVITPQQHAEVLDYLND